MGESKRYYYIKKKNQSSFEDVDFRYEKPQVVLQPIFSTSKLSNKALGNVLDMNFKTAVNPHTWLISLRWLLFATLAIVVYIGGYLLNSEGNYLIADLVRKGEAATINLEKGAAALSSFDMENALINFRLADRNFKSALDSFARLGQQNVLLAGLPLERSQILQAQSLVGSGQHLSQAGIDITEALIPLVDYWSAPDVLNDSLQNVGNRIGKLLIASTSKIDSALKEVALADQMLSNVNLNYTAAGYAELVINAQEKTTAFKQALETVGLLAKNLPPAMGFDNPQYYLLLNQNSNEARATGGFIGSYALLELYKGKLDNVFVDTTQRIDGQNLYNDQVLPKPLEEVTSYYGIRDANWEPNFPTSVRTIQKLYEQAGGGTVDGMIAITPDVIADCLEVLGPVYMDEYDINLTASNFASRLQKHIEIDAQGTYNPKQLLVDVTPIIVTRLLDADSRQINAIGKKLLQRLMTKDILLNFSDPGLESVISTVGWSGEIPDILPQTDYLYIVESNLGGNKSSGSLVREINHHSLVSSNGALLDSLRIVYSHQGTDEFPDGINKNYLRIYLPQGSRISKTIGYDMDTQVDIDTSDGKTVVGFWVTTSPGESSIIELEYILPFRIDFDKDVGQYRLVIQKQPGIKKTLFKSQIEVSGNLSLNERSDQEYNTLFFDQFIRDEVLIIPIYKK